MRKALALLVCSLMFGCGGKQAAIVLDGDLQLAGGKYCVADQRYVSALAQDPDLSRDEKFTTNALDMNTA